MIYLSKGGPVPIRTNFQDLAGIGLPLARLQQPFQPSSVLKVLATIPYFNFHFFPHLLIFLQFRDPSYVLNLSTKAVLQKWHI